jgi:peroxiredoxin Q/BCP
LSQLRQDYATFLQKNSDIVVIGPETAEKFKNYWTEHDLPYIGLPDPKHEVLQLYGQQIKIFKFGRMPAQVMIDRNGIARYIHYGSSMSDIPKNEELFGLLDEFNREMDTCN